MRILHVLDHSLPVQSGYAVRTAAILEQQRALGWHTLQLTGPRHQAAQNAEQIDGLNYHRTRSGGTLGRLPLLRHAAVVAGLGRRILEVAALEQPDLLHAHSPCLNGVAALWAARRLRLPVVYEMRASWEDAAVDQGATREGSPRYRASRALETYVLRKTDAVTTICRGLHDEILGRGVPADRVTVIPNSIDPGHFEASRAPDGKLRSELGLDGRTVLGFIGSFYSWEGLELLLQALPVIAVRRPDVSVLLVGGGNQEARLRELARRPGLHERMVLAGRVPHSAVHRYYDLIDILVYPRLSMRLTELVTPLKPLEAMAQGRLIVASDVGGHRELIEDGVTGTLFRAGDPADLAEKVISLLADPTRWDERRRNARAYVKRERDWKSNIRGYEGVYASALAAHQGPVRS